jgi:hypothetical protein
MKQKDIILLLVPSFLLVLVWIGFSIYHNFVTSTISQTLNIQILPIAPTFDTKTIAKLKGRQQVVPLYQTTASSPSPSPQITSSSGSLKNSSTSGGLQ